MKLEDRTYNTQLKQNKVVDMTATTNIATPREQMMAASNKATAEAQIRAIINDRVKAVHAKDINAVMTNHAPDVLMFDVVNPLRYIGSDTVKERVKEWFSLYQGPIGYEVRDVNITTGYDVGFCHYLYEVSGTKMDGGKVDMWVRSTVCFRKFEGEWMVTHEHDSVPFDPASGKASLDLKP